MMIIVIISPAVIPKNNKQILYSMTDILAQYGIDLKQIRDSITEVHRLKAQATFGVIEDPMFTHMVQNSMMRYEDLETIINKTLQMYHLAQPVMSMFDPVKEQIKIHEIIEKLLGGKYYQKLQEQNPVWLLTNRQTQLNIKIILACVLLKTAKKLTLDEMKEAIMVFTLEENKDRNQGVKLVAARIIQVLRNLNKTVSVNFLDTWIRSHKFEVEGWIMPHQFLYLVCFCSDRSVYMRLLPKANYKRIKNPNTCLYEIQPIKQIIGTPDFKIQQKLKEAVTQPYDREVFKEKTNEQKVSKSKTLAKSFKNLSQLQKMLRDSAMYGDIRHCLKSREKSAKVNNCLTRIKSATTITRPQTAMHPIRINEIVNAQPDYFSFGLQNILTQKSEAAPKPRTIYSRAKNNSASSKRYESHIVERKIQHFNRKMERSLCCQSNIA